MSRRGRVYTPAATVQAERDIREAWEIIFHDVEPAVGPLYVELALRNDEFSLYVEEADDYTNRQVRGDVDNLAKLILDSLNEKAWVDDRQIVDLRVYKD